MAEGLYWRVIAWLRARGVAVEGPASVPGIELRDDGAGPAIAAWDVARYGPVPTVADLEALPAEVVAAAARPRRVSAVEFARLFSQAERIAVRTRQAAGGPAGAVLEDFYSLLALAGSVSLDDPDVAAAAAFMETIGVLAPGRAAAIVAGLPPS